VRRPDIASIEVQPFLDSLEEWLRVAATELEPTFSNEPRRLLDAREYRAAVIAAITHLETTLRERLDLPPTTRKRIVSVREMLDMAHAQNLLGKFEVRQVLEWLKVRNEVVHSHAQVTAPRAREIVTGVTEITGQLH
jgi:hypothetical protein